MDVFEKLEQYRLNYNRYNKWGTRITIVGIVARLGDSLGLLSDHLWWLGWLGVGAGLSLMMIADFRFQKPFTRIYKGELVQSVFAENIGGFDDLRYLPDDGITEDTIESTGMMQMGNDYESGDLIEGSYKGVGFKQSDVCIQQITSGKHTRIETYFSGRWMIFDFNKRFRADLQVCEREFMHACSFGGIFSKGEKLHTLETESVAFNRAFSVAAENDSEAFYILTPHFMEKLLEVKAKISGDLLFCFIDSQLHVAINDEHNNFEPNMAVPIDVDSIRRSVLADLEPITELINILRLDNRFFITE